METKTDGKFKRTFKRFGALGLACVLSVAIALTLALCLPKGGVEVSVGPADFALPMQNATVVKDYADYKLQYNDTLERWDCHLSVDLVSDDDNVMAIYDGIVKECDDTSVDGAYMAVEHEGGFVSVYSSLEKGLNYRAGDKVNKGEVIGKASDTAGNESKTGGHLHFTLFKDGIEVDPNLYLDLQNK